MDCTNCGAEFAFYEILWDEDGQARCPDCTSGEITVPDVLVDRVKATGVEIKKVVDKYTDHYDRPEKGGMRQ